MTTARNPLLARLVEYPQARMERVKAELRAAGKPVYDFGIGDPREPTPRFIVEALRAAVPDVSQYPSVVGRPELREAVAGYAQRRFGVALDPATQVVPSGGAKEALFHAAFSFVDPRGPRNLVVYGVPAYPVYERAALFSGGEPYPVQLTREGGFLLDLDALPASVLDRAAMVIVDYPHNPTGATAPLSYYRRLVELSAKHGFVLCSDEPYTDLYVGDAPASALQAGPDGVLVFGSCSKRSGMTGYRSGFVAGDAQLVRALKDSRPNFGVASPDFVQLAAAAAWRDDVHAAERREIFAEKRARLLAFLARAGLVAEGGGAFYLWVAVPKGETSASYEARLLTHGVVVAGPSMFGPSSEGYVRLAMVPTLAEIGGAIAAWEAAL